jgi:hypothetical protein
MPMMERLFDSPGVGSASRFEFPRRTRDAEIVRVRYHDPHSKEAPVMFKKVAALLAAGTVGLVVGLSAAPQASSELEDCNVSLLARNLTVASLASVALDVLEQGRTHVAKHVMENMLRDSILDSSRLVRSGVRVGQPVPSLLDGFRSAAEYGRKNGWEEALIADAEMVVEALEVREAGTTD